MSTARGSWRRTHLDALGVLQPLLEHSHDGVGLEVDDEVDAAGEDSVRGLASEHVAGVGHAERLRLEGVPRAAAGHGLVREVGDGVDGLAAHDGSGFV